jgi:hypothetical protein
MAERPGMPRPCNTPTQHLGLYQRNPVQYSLYGRVAFRKRGSMNCLLACKFNLNRFAMAIDNADRHFIKE